MLIPMEKKMEKNVKKQSAKEKRQMANMLYGKPQNSNTQINIS